MLRDSPYSCIHDHYFPTSHEFQQSIKLRTIADFWPHLIIIIAVSENSSHLAPCGHPSTRQEPAVLQTMSEGLQNYGWQVYYSLMEWLVLIYSSNRHGDKEVRKQVLGPTQFVAVLRQQVFLLIKGSKKHGQCGSFLYCPTYTALYMPVLCETERNQRQPSSLQIGAQKWLCFQ